MRKYMNGWQHFCSYPPTYSPTYSSQLHITYRSTYCTYSIHHTTVQTSSSDLSSWPSTPLRLFLLLHSYKLMSLSCVHLCLFWDWMFPPMTTGDIDGAQEYIQQTLYIYILGLLCTSYTYLHTYNTNLLPFYLLRCDVLGWQKGIYKIKCNIITQQMLDP